jgi:hypothetical protein
MLEAIHPTLMDFRVTNSDTGQLTTLTARQDRLDLFMKALKEDATEPVPSWGPGVCGAAVVGINCIFAHIPQRFPMADILRVLGTYEGSYSADKIEAVLAKFGFNHSTLFSDGTEVE